MRFDRVVPGQRGDGVIPGLTGAKKISSLSPANPTRIIYWPNTLPAWGRERLARSSLVRARRPRSQAGGSHVAMRAERGKVAIALMRCISLKGAVAIRD